LFAVLAVTLQDVELQSNCCLSCFGLKAVNVQTAGQGGAITPEVSAVFLKSPEKAREAIRLAVKLHQQGKMQGGTSGYAAPRAGTWGEVVPAGPAAAAAKGAGLAQRLQGLEGLVTRGVLAKAEADALKVRLSQHVLPMSHIDVSWFVTVADHQMMQMHRKHCFSRSRHTLRWTVYFNAGSGSIVGHGNADIEVCLLRCRCLSLLLLMIPGWVA
jgi:hypothetical protein